MASGSKPDIETSEQDAVPTSVIAQAEAAIIGNFEDDSAPVSRQTSWLSRQSSRVSTRSDFTRHGLPDLTRATTAGSMKGHHLQVPNILDDNSPDAPPAYGSSHDQIDLSQDGFSTNAKVADDGRVNININQKTRKLSDLLVPALRNQLSLVAQEDEHPLPPGYIPPALGGLPGQVPPPKLNVVIHVVGSRGDVQPFVALGKTLKATYGHRVRLATHPTFKTFVEENGLEFFSIGGDPSELMAFMVKNPGLMPGFDSLKSGDVGKRRKGMEEIVLGCWRSCIEAGDGLGASPKKDSVDSAGVYDAGINMDQTDRPFIADAIIANPPSFAHIHIAEKMGIPLHMMFTMPWSPTQQFPHPLANIQSSNADVNMTNFVSYALVEMMTWQGLGDVINRFRERALGLEPISLIWAPGMLSRLRVPYTYCWSPALIPKPKDWGQHITISGFYFLSLASSYTPEPELAAYLRDGPPPVYIGFGSIVVDDPNAMTQMIFEAVKKAGVRALVSKGWGGLGADELGIPEGVFMLGNVPHDWLFQHVSAVVHHGGAGTTAAGIATGKPTVVVPFFGDQPFWGAMVARAGAGPVPIPYKQLTAEKLAAALLEALKPETLERAKELGAKIKEEKGTEMGAKSFHDLLDVDALRCSVDPRRVAVWRVKRTTTRLSALAANVLAQEGLLDFADLKLHRSKEYETDDGPWDPISGGASALLGTIASLGMGVADFPIEIFRGVKRVGTKIEEKHAERVSTKSGEKSFSPGGTTPADSTSQSRSLSRSQSQLNFLEEPSPLSPGIEGTTSPGPMSSPSSTSTITSPKTSLDSRGRSSVETAPNEIPFTSTNSQTSFSGRGGSLKAALSGTLCRSGSQDRGAGGSGSRSSSKTRRQGSRSGSPFGSLRKKEPNEFDPSQLTLENATRAGKGVSRIVGAGLKSPMDFTLGIARGFHNAPKLYGDDTVRPHEKVTDLQSGLKAAGKEFGFGFYDGITGLVTQPISGAKKEGTAGLIKGIGKGIGGLILKPGAAIWGLPGYAFMGVHKEVRKIFGSSVLNYMITARTAQGYEDFQASTFEERQEIVSRWRIIKEEYQNSKTKTQEQGGPEGQENGHLMPKGFMQTRHLTFDERKNLYEQRRKRREQEREEEKKRYEEEHGHPYCPFCRRTGPHSHKPRAVQTAPVVIDNRDTQDQFEHAIHASVAATSCGNVEEDRLIEKAIRASVRELQSAQGSNLDDEEAMNRAIQASISEARRKDNTSASSVTLTEEDAAHQAALEKAIQDSLNQYQISHPDRGNSNEDEQNLALALKISKEAHLPPAASAVALEEVDKELELALKMSREAQAPPVAADDSEDGEELKLAMQQSQKELLGQKTEEEIVMEYVKKQSLLEMQHKYSFSGKGKESRDAPAPDQVSTPVAAEAEKIDISDADEEALKMAIEQSMRDSNAAGPSSSSAGT